MKLFIKKYFPYLSRILGLILNFLNWYKNKKNYEIMTKYNFNLINIENYENTFFGYYDKSPFNPSNDNLVIFHANNFNAFKNPQADIPTDICLYDMQKKKVTVLDTTYSWNWQQGSRLHWLNEKEIIFNIYNKEEKSFNAKVINTESNESKILPIPVQDSYKDHYIVSLDYQIMSKIRPDYGYRNIVENNQKDVFYYGLKDGILKKLVDIELLIKDYIGQKYTQSNTVAKINHIMISPDGKKMIFLLRYYIGDERKHKLFLYSFIDGISLLIDKNIISHYCWLDDESIFFWGNINGVGGYYKYTIADNHTENMGFSLPDGHPSVINKNLILTDTYPNASRMRELYILNLNEKSTDKIGEFFEPLQTYGETRCDLHPKLSNSKKYIHCDTIFKKRRQLCIMEYK